MTKGRDGDNQTHTHTAIKNRCSGKLAPTSLVLSMHSVPEENRNLAGRIFLRKFATLRSAILEPKQVVDNYVMMNALSK